MINDVLDRIPTTGELQNHESMIINDGESGIFEMINIDGTLYRNSYLDETDSGILDTLAGFDVTDNGLNSSDGSISFNSSDETLVVYDEGGDARVILGRLTTSNTYGLKMLNEVGTTIFNFDTDAAYAEIAGWKFNNTQLWTSSSGSFPGNPDTAGATYQGLIFSNVSGIQKMSLFNDNNNYLWWDGSVLRIKSEYFTLDETGNITATGGTIAGWEMGTNLLRSASSGARIELNKAKNRISIFSGSGDDKVAMGYLDTLLKSNGVKVGTTTYDSTSMTDPGRTEAAENTWEDDALIDLYIKPAGKDRVQITDNTANTITVSSWTGGTPSENDDFRIEFGSADYGFWVLPGDRLQIDGDINYEGGDWLIQHDASLKIFNGGGNEIIRLGTDSGEKGLFLYNTSGTTLAKFHSTGIQLGDTATEHMLVSTTSIKFRTDNSTTRVELVDDVLTLGGANGATTDCTVIGSAGVKIYGSASTNFVNIDSDEVIIQSSADDKVTIDADGIVMREGGADVMSLAGGNISMTGKIILTSFGDDSVVIGTNNNDLGVRNIIIGIEAGNSLTADSNDEIFIGYQSGKDFEDGTSENNVGIGSYTLKTTPDARQCVGIGHRAMEFMGGTLATAGVSYHNISVGYQAMSGLEDTKGSNAFRYNVAIGAGAMQNATNAADDDPGNKFIEYNTGVGHQSLQNVELVNLRYRGSNNTAFGARTGTSITTGRENVCIGSQSDVSSATAINQIVIGYNTIGLGNNYVVLGNVDVDRIYCAYDGDAVLYADATIVSSDRRTKENVNDIGLGLDFVNKLKPIQFNKRQPADYEESLKSKIGLYEEGLKKAPMRVLNEKEKSKLRTGFIAQEVGEVLEELGFSSNNNIIQIDEKTTQQRMDYASMVVPLVKAVQELSAKVKALEDA